MSVAEIVSIQVGRPQVYDDPPRFVRRPAPWRSGFVKAPVRGTLRLDTLNLDGDGQGDLRAHGGVDKAVNVYAAEHYAHWQAQGLIDAFAPGTFGENFCIRGLLEADVCIGDIFSVGEALVQISQPRQPCWKLAHFLDRADAVRRLVDSGRTGWYFRVLQPGNVMAGQRLALQERPHGEWTVARANEVMHHARDPHQEEQLWACPALSTSWRRNLGRRLGRE